jgi:hypothetical protein
LARVGARTLLSVRGRADRLFSTLVDGCLTYLRVSQFVPVCPLMAALDRRSRRAWLTPITLRMSICDNALRSEPGKLRNEKTAVVIGL